MMNTASKEYFSEHQRYIKLAAEIGVLILAFVFLLLPGTLRESDFPIGEEAYYHLARSESVFGTGFGWNFLLGYFPLNFLLLFTGLLSLLFIFLNLKMLKLEEKLLALGFFIVSPAFVYLFNVGERFGAGFLFSLIASYFLFDKKYLIAAAISLLILLFDIWMGFFILFLIMLYFLLMKEKKKFFYLLIGVFLFSTLLLGDFSIGIVSDLGAKVGSSVFALSFALGCFLFFWNKKKFLLLYWAAGLLFLFSLKVEFGIFYFSLLLSTLMSICFFELLRAKWESKLIRDLILLIIVCGLMFSGLSYANRISKEKPADDIFNALNKLPDDAVVFSGVEYGNWIEYSGKKSVWHSFMNRDKIERIEGDFSAVLDSRDYSGVIGG